MIEVIVKVPSMDAARAGLKSGIAGYPGILSGRIQRAGVVFRDHVKRMQPVSAKTTGYGVRGLPKDTGNLGRQIKARQIQMLAAGVAGWATYDPFVQLGTSKMPPRPYMQWALEDGGLKKIDEEIRGAVDWLHARLLS